ncbi:MAG: putative nitrogen fixation protein NifT [Campylobacterales bacterium]|nr:putative nitrogen fixation protein NifT [Campylobacterales bacterium]
MAKIMFNFRNDKVMFYLAKKDLEEPVVTVEFDTDEKWGGKIEIGNGEIWEVEPIAKKFPVEVNAKKL